MDTEGLGPLKYMALQWIIFFFFFPFDYQGMGFAPDSKQRESVVTPEVDVLF